MSQTSASASDLPGEGRTIVMVEDHPDVMVMGAEMLRDAGFEVVEFETADAALAAMQAGRPCDLLFTDIVMPGGMDGLELAREARTLQPDLPILLTTGWADRAREDPLNLQLIGKPYRQSDLVRTVQDLLAP